MLVLSIELAAVVALLAIPAWQPDLDGRRFLRLVVVLWGTTAFGAIHTMAEYLVMVKFSDANWDCPPGTGYLTVAVITISAILTAIMTLRTPHRSGMSRIRTTIQGRSSSPERPQNSLKCNCASKKAQYRRRVTLRRAERRAVYADWPARQSCRQAS